MYYTFLDITGIVIVIVVDHPRSGVVYNFGRFCTYLCLFVCLSVCLSDDNFRKTSRRKFIGYLHIRCMSRQYGSSSYMKVMGSRPRSQNRKRSTIGTHATDACVSGQIHLRVVSILSPITRSRTAVKCVCSIGFAVHLRPIE